MSPKVAEKSKLTKRGKRRKCMPGKDLVEHIKAKIKARSKKQPERQHLIYKEG